MAHVDGVTGSLSYLLGELERNRITFLDSLSGIISFGKNFDSRLVDVQKKARESVFSEREALRQKVTKLANDFGIATKEREDILPKEKNDIEVSS